MGGATFGEKISRENSVDITPYLSEAPGTKMNHEQEIYVRYLSSCPENPEKYGFCSFQEQLSMFEALFGSLVPQKNRAKTLDSGPMAIGTLRALILAGNRSMQERKMG